MTPLLSAKYNMIDQLRTRLDIHHPKLSAGVEMSDMEWRETLPGGLGRTVPTPFEEPFSLGVGCMEAGAEMLDFDVPHTLEVWVIRGAFDLRLGEGPWLPQRQGSFYILAPGQCHSLRVQERAYLVSTLCPPLPIALPPTEYCS